jgi:SAM-dependent methyltransferase
LGNQYLSEFRRDDQKPSSFPLDLMLCDNCGQVQLGESVSSGLLYTDNYGYRSGINDTMRQHLHDLVNEALTKTTVRGPVVDIGSNDGTLLKNYVISFKNSMKRIGFDLVSKFAKEYEGTDITFVSRAFDEKYYLDNFSKASIITAISMFYDLEDPVDFLKQLRKCLRDDGIIVIQQNYLVSMLKNVSFDNICAEHIFYHSLTSMMNIVAESGLEIFDVSENELNGGSFRVFLCHKNSKAISDRVSTMFVKELFLKNASTYSTFFSAVKLAKQKTYSFIRDEVEKGKTVYVLGASTRGNTLLQYYGLDNLLIKKAVERNPEKFGTVIASSGIPIISENEARNDHPDFMLVLPWFFGDEIVEREKEYLNDGGKLIFPLPEFRVIKRL